jgi:hypothetical protein
MSAVSPEARRFRGILNGGRVFEAGGTLVIVREYVGSGLPFAGVELRLMLWGYWVDRLVNLQIKIA